MYQSNLFEFCFVFQDNFFRNRTQNRLKKHYHQVDNNPEELLAENTYNDLSQLVNKKVGSTSGSAPLQSIDYDYNIRGWMTEINKNQMAVTDLGGKLFSYKIKYTSREGIENPDTAQFSGKNVVPKYNGNIAEVDWRAVESIGSNPSTTPKRYGYAYDKINRLTAGFYQNPQNPNSKENTESLAYDLNGNITSLYRTSVLEYGNTTPTMIDNLQYIYASGNVSNRLTNINDYAQNATGYEGGGQTIEYDLNGNMISMPDKGISVIKYNHLNLPHHLEYSRDGIEMVKLDTKYRADGTKLRKVNTTTISGINGYTTSVKTIDYLDGFQYQNITNSGGGGGGSSSFSASNLESSRAMETQAFSLVDIGGLEPIGMIKNSDLQFFPTAEGFYDYQKDQYIYQYKDHLGNTRVSFGRNSAGALEIVDANDYYPFGMNHLKSGNSFFGSSSYKNYKYNGKELQETGMYDYGARFYMADIGRWGVVDPLAEKTMDIYGYVWNNPIKFIDPDGQSGEPTLDKKNKTITINQHLIFYGGKATSKLSDKIATGISSQWNGANGRVKVGGVEYKVKFKVTYETVSEVDAKKMASGNTDIKNNFIRVEDGKNGESSFTQELGANSYYFNTDDDLAGSTTPAHEIGHGLGLDHTNKGGQNENDVPDIMEARGTQVHPKWSKKGPSNSIDPNFRRVDKTEVYDVLKGVRFDKNGKGKIGKTTNKIYDKNGN